MFLHASAATLAASPTPPCAKDFTQNDFRRGLGSCRPPAKARLHILVRKHGIVALTRTQPLLASSKQSNKTPISRGANRLLPRTRLLPTSSEDPRHANPQERYRKTCHKSASSEDSALADLQRGPDLQGVRTTHKFQSFAGKLD